MISKLRNLLPLLLLQRSDHRTPEGIPIIIITPSMEEAIKTQTKPVRWLDDRIYCKYARAQNIDGAAACPERFPTYCGLTGRSRRLPCAFDEPENSTIWQRIRASVAYYQQEGWGDDHKTD